MLKKEILIDESVALIQGLSLFSPDDKGSSMMLVPDNSAELFIILRSKMGVRPVGHTRRIDLESGGAYFFMPRRRGLEIVNAQVGCKFLVIKLDPMYSKRIVDSLQEMVGGVYQVQLDLVDLEQLNKKNYVGITEWLMKAFKLPNIEAASNSTVTDSIDRIKHSSGSITIKEIYSSLSVSKSKLEQHFHREIGLTPKEFCKIEKINYFINAYRKNSNRSLTELTYECGYYDQSHLIKDFRYFMDLSPKKYFEMISE